MSLTEEFQSLINCFTKWHIQNINMKGGFHMQIVSKLTCTSSTLHSFNEQKQQLQFKTWVIILFYFILFYVLVTSNFIGWAISPVWPGNLNSGHLLFFIFLFYRSHYVHPHHIPRTPQKTHLLIYIYSSGKYFLKIT